ncbi:MAG TPA: hypothetical protein VJK29_00360 [Terriglobales bacterium]|nr:hypothetical protein [Terriglobales bacterium]
MRPQSERQLTVAKRREDVVQPPAFLAGEQVALEPLAPTGYNNGGHSQHGRQFGREHHRRGLRLHPIPANAIIATRANAIQRTVSNVLGSGVMVVDGCYPAPHRVEISV